MKLRSALVAKNRKIIFCSLLLSAAVVLLAGCEAANVISGDAAKIPSKVSTITIEPRSDTSINIAWKKTENATHYNLYRSTATDGTYALIHTVMDADMTMDGTNYTDQNLVANTTYYYRLAACTGTIEMSHSCAAQSTVTEGKTQLSPPDSAPMVDSETGGALAITWSEITDATEYRIYRAESMDGMYDLIHTATGEASTSYTDTGGSTRLASNTAYYYRLAVCNGAVGDNGAADNSCSAQSTMSATATTSPSTPSISVTPARDTALAIAWGTVEGAMHYRIYRSDSREGTYTLVHTVNDADATSYTDNTGLTGNTTYYYRIAACAGTEDNTCSVQSPSADSLTGIGAPGGLTAVYETVGTELSITWNEITGATQYRLYRSESRGDDNTPYTMLVHTAIGNAATMYTDSGLTTGRTYYYRIASCTDASTCTSQSPATTGTTLINPPTAEHRTAGTSLVITWPARSGATQYRLYRSDSRDGSYALVHTATSGTMYTDNTGLAIGDTYYYRIAACTGSADDTCTNQSPPSAMGTTLLTPPMTDYTTASPATVAITWDAYSGAERYRIYRSGSVGGAYTRIHTATSVAPYTDSSGLTVGNTYYYRIDACTGSADTTCTTQSPATEIELLAAPTGVAAVPVIVAGFTPSFYYSPEWTMPVTGATHYHIYRSATENGVYTSIGVVSARSGGYRDSNPEVGDEYWYRVAACTGTGEGTCSAQSAAARFTLSPPSTVTATTVNGTTATITWNIASGARQYEVYRSSTSATTGYARVAEIERTTAGLNRYYTDTGLTAGTTYYYQIRACIADTTCSGDSSSSSAAPPASAGTTYEAQHIAAGGSTSCAIRGDNTLLCWGENGSGQLGIGNTTDQITPHVVDLNGASSGAGTAIQVATGGSHACAITGTGTSGGVRCWGANISGQLGIGSNANQNSPHVVDLNGSDGGMGTATHITAGDSHTCAILTGGGVRCWGGNFNGALGIGATPVSANTPQVVDLNPSDNTSNGTAIQIAAGNSYTCAILTGGSVSCWGINNAGQLGIGRSSMISDNDDFKKNTPQAAVNLGSGRTATQIVAGPTNTCVVLDDNSGRCWGSNSAQQLKANFNSDPRFAVPSYSSPQTITAPGGTTFKRFTTGQDYICAILGNDSVACWGRNREGQLGTGTTTNLIPPTVIDINGGGSGNGTAIGIAAGGSHTCAILSSDKSVRCWGNGQDGRVGVGRLFTYPTPVGVGLHTP